MRNLEAERKIIERAFMLAGATLVAGLISLAIGTELLVLSYYNVDPIMFWIWQGTWAVVISFIISGLARLISKHG
jgi:hypothetical protein